MIARPQQARDPMRWRMLAKALLPQIYEQFDADGIRDGDGLMQFLFVLLPATRNAHRSGDEWVLFSAYAFAHWCMAQPEKELWNAAGVAFFEHLFDDLAPETVVPWIAPKALSEIGPLVEFRLGVARMREIEKAYSKRHVCREHGYPGIIARAERLMRQAS